MSFRKISEGLYVADPSILTSDPSKAGSINIRYNKRLDRVNGLIMNKHQLQLFHDYNNKKKRSNKLISKKAPENLESTNYMRYENILSGDLKPTNQRYLRLRKIITRDLPKDQDLESSEIPIKPGGKTSSPGYGYILPKEQGMDQQSYHIEDVLHEEKKFNIDMEKYEKSIDEFRQKRIGGTTGVEMCENSNYDKVTCNNIGCCKYNDKDKQCKSKVGKNPCFHG